MPEGFREDPYHFLELSSLNKEYFYWYNYRGLMLIEWSRYRAVHNGSLSALDHYVPSGGAVVTCSAGDTKVAG